jgi:hypothetical protein
MIISPFSRYNARPQKERTAHAQVSSTFLLLSSRAKHCFRDRASRLDYQKVLAPSSSHEIVQQLDGPRNHFEAKPEEGSHRFGMAACVV